MTRVLGSPPMRCIYIEGIWQGGCVHSALHIPFARSLHQHFGGYSVPCCVQHYPFHSNGAHTGWMLGVACNLDGEKAEHLLRVSPEIAQILWVTCKVSPKIARILSVKPSGTMSNSTQLLELWALRRMTWTTHIKSETRSMPCCCHSLPKALCLRVGVTPSPLRRGP